LINLEKVVIVAGRQKSEPPLCENTIPSLQQTQYKSPDRCFSKAWDNHSYRLHVQYVCNIRSAATPTPMLWDRSWSFMAKDVASRWEAYILGFGVEKIIRVRRGLVTYIQGTGIANEVAFPGGGDIPCQIRDTIEYNKSIRK